VPVQRWKLFGGLTFLYNPDRENSISPLALIRAGMK
jgi:hypothetical protein